jgi:hypothetical protein
MAAPLPPWYQPVTYSGVSDNLQNLDQSGTNCQFLDVWQGPSLGWGKLAVASQMFVTSTAPLTIPPTASRVLLRAAVTAIALPSVASWVLAFPATAGQIAFDRSLWIKDLSGTASALAPIVITPAGTDQIDELSSFQIITANELIRLYPISDLSGWMVG